MELFQNIDKAVTNLNKNSQGISVTVYDPSNKEVAEYSLLQETHKGFQKIIATTGVHRVCVSGAPNIFRKNPSLKYEMSIQIEASHVHSDEDAHPSSVISVDSLVTREHIDKVDIEIDLLTKKAETIV